MGNVATRRLEFFYENQLVNYEDWFSFNHAAMLRSTSWSRRPESTGHVNYGITKNNKSS